MTLPHFTMRKSQDAPAAPPKPAGTELLLRSMGLGEIIEAAKAFANAGTMAKIFKFAEDAEELTHEIKALGSRLDRLEDALRGGGGLRPLADSDAAYGEPGGNGVFRWPDGDRVPGAPGAD